MQPGEQQEQAQRVSNFIHWYGRIHEQLGKMFQGFASERAKKYKFGKENRPGGRTCNAGTHKH